MNKLFSRLALVSLALIFILFLVLGNTFIYQKQRTSYLDAFKETQQTDIKLLSQLAREALITQNYALIEWFFNTWGRDYQKVVKLTLENNNGFSLSQYQRRKAAAGNTITSTNTLNLYDGSYTISITSDSKIIDTRLDDLKQQMLLVNIGATILLILNLWFLFQRFAIRHLHHEVRLRKTAEEKLRQLEKNR